jgi:hypothetical protein
MLLFRSVTRSCIMEKLFLFWKAFVSQNAEGSGRQSDRGNNQGKEKN